MSTDDLTTLMRTAVADAPEHDLSVPTIAGLAHARTQRRRLWYGVAGLGAAAAVVGVVAVGGGLLAAPAPVSVAGPSAPAPNDVVPSAPVDPGAISLPTSLPLGEAVAVVDAALPSGFSVGELAVDAAWTPDGGLELALVTPTGASTLALSAGAGGCTATSDALGDDVLDAVSASICTAKAAYPQEPGTVVDGGPADPAA